MKLSEELKARGFVYQFSTESLGEILDSEKRTVYLGVDPTADAMHVGHLVPYMLLNHLMGAGHKVILLVGGGTALIGDPSGKDSERPYAEEKVITTQAKKLEQNVRAITVSDKIRFVNNYDWLADLSMLEFLRDVGKHFTVNAMMKKDSVSARLSSEQGISYTEFSYALLQSYDFYHLHKEYGCDLQIGASDQWGNIVSGIDFVRRKCDDTVYGLTMPLIINPATGKKFGKSEGGAVWLDPTKTSPYAFYQFWLNTPDDSVESYLKLFTFASLEEIQVVMAESSANPGDRLAQKQLALAVTKFVHGEKLAEAVVKVSSLLFGTETIGNLSPEEKQILLENAPNFDNQNGKKITEVLLATGLASSNREAREFVSAGAVTLDGKKVEDVEFVVRVDQVGLLKRGKKNLVVLVGSKGGTSSGGWFKKLFS